MFIHYPLMSMGAIVISKDGEQYVCLTIYGLNAEGSWHVCTYCRHEMQGCCIPEDFFDKALGMYCIFLFMQPSAPNNG